ncbi:thioredoxin domain-containing protein [Salinibacterium soli]|uniref:Thioredoxin domain-containing protein n=1 Tax=Antiquaquibacter soli TaxID=3064523 RepID=A0ABT9BUX9_9MICO|nr:thioredoxin domain-containing protein [Protaetiibacter sp. WY-16]MDO7883210.1 thioredoxin domain-containing protein [Protaetiibacter sp. WY-16]
MPNRLAAAASPYLRSHADNPVDWWAWGPEPFAEARRRDVPVLVSIGYSTCHWCHVMARESFSDSEVAAYLNENLVAIKVDREEHSEVDATYLAAAGAFTPNLGWPLNVFVTPEGRAFFAGTYWPPEPVQGIPSFRQVVEAVLNAWRDRRAEVESNGDAIVAALTQPRAATGELPTDLSPVVAALEAQEDPEFGGFGTAPKFPVAPVVRFLVDRGEPLGMRLLDAMAASPLRDPVDGGFFRYSTRRDWSEPHYERMLYDNAQLLAAYAVGAATSGSLREPPGTRFADVADGIASFLLDTLRTPAGTFASAQDSESTVDGQRVEGFYYSLDAASRSRLDPPPIDGKVLTGWNGLAIEALALAGRLLGRPEWVQAAAEAADVLLAGPIIHSSIDGVASSAPVTLEDYGMLARGLLELATTTGEVRYAEAGRDLVDASLEAGDPFGVPGGGDPVLAAQGIVVEADDSDGAHPSGRSAMADAALVLYQLTAERRYRDAASRAVQRVAHAATTHPVSLGAALGVISRLAAPARQLVVVGHGELAEAAARAPGLVAIVSPEQAASWSAAGFELFDGRVEQGGRSTAYVCEDFVCRLPVTEPGELMRLLS